ncbi:MAG TPA: helix-turn-helix domain-containing protein [Solirubrobacterales bacterium]|nr:helix-turn-helix domain-containing protein [Solirubrobacterales bacterium]
MTTKPPTSREPFVNVAEIARLLDVPPSFIYERTARGEIPCYRVGRLLRFKVSEVESWLSECAGRERRDG